MEVDAQGVSHCAFLPRAAYKIGVASGASQFSPNVEGLATVKGSFILEGWTVLQFSSRRPSLEGLWAKALGTGVGKHKLGL